jgi:hypothetical protein
VIPVALFLFPPKLKNPDGQYLKWLLVYHRLAGEAIPPIQLLNSRAEIISPREDTLSWCTMFDDGVQYAVNRPLKLEGTHLSFDSEEIYINELIQYRGNNIDTATEKEFTDKVTDILVQTLLYLQLEPQTQLIEATPQGQKPGNKSKKGKLPPKIIGDNYKIKRELTSDPTSKHKSLITHWRMGHYRMQPYGDRQNPQHKLIWIEPTLING